MAELRLRLEADLRLGRSQARLALAAVLLCAAATETVSESFTLTTYYPAPSGVYQRMITTEATVLARDGGAVGIGVSAPMGKLDVAGGVSVGAYAGAAIPPGNGLILSGNIGVGTPVPNAAAPNGTGSGNVDVNDVYVRSLSRWLSQMAAGIAVTAEYNCDAARGQVRNCPMGAHMACFLTAAGGGGDDQNRCLINGGPPGWSIDSWNQDDPTLNCRARCLDIAAP